jgi:putative oxidoreductase
MKFTLFSITRHSRNVDLMALLMRLVTGGFMLTHGWGKLAKLMAGQPYQFADPLGMGVTPSLLLAVFAEVGCAVLIIVGLATRLATIPIMITMLVAAFIIMGTSPFNLKELSLLYFTLLVVILVIGPGRYSLDRLIRRRGH